MPELRARLITSLEQTEGVRAHWDKLYKEAVNPSPFQSFEWVTEVAKYFSTKAYICLGLVEFNGKPKGIIPLELTSERIGPLRCSVLRLIGDLWSNRNTGIFIGEAEISNTVKEFLSLLLREKRWTYCHIRRVPKDAALLNIKWKECGRALGLRCELKRVDSSIVIDLPDSWELFRSRLSMRHRRNLLWRSNVLKRQGKVMFNRIGPTGVWTQEELNKSIQDALRVSETSWQGSAEKGHAISDPDIRSFFIEVSQRLASKGGLDLSLLYINGRPISFAWGICRWPYTAIIKQGFDRDLAKLRPGGIHMAKLIEDSIEHGIREIDLGPEFLEYKQEWGKRLDELWDIYCYKETPIGHALRWWRHRLRNNCMV